MITIPRTAADQPNETGWFGEAPPSLGRLQQGSGPKSSVPLCASAPEVTRPSSVPLQSNLPHWQSSCPVLPLSAALTHVSVWVEAVAEVHPAPAEGVAQRLTDRHARTSVPRCEGRVDTPTVPRPSSEWWCVQKPRSRSSPHQVVHQ